MKHVQFDDQYGDTPSTTYRTPELFKPRQTPVMVTYLIKVGIVKRERTGMILLVIFLIFLIAATTLVIWYPNRNNGMVILEDGTRVPIEEYAKQLRFEHELWKQSQNLDARAEPTILNE